jgi:alpha-N-arabinofuranosidase
VVATADHVGAVRGSSKRIQLSFDEWNIWYNTRFENVDKIEGVDNWPTAPRLLEDVYTVTDAVVFGSLMISLLKHADRVTSASLAQLVNVIAPIMTEPGGPAWRQTTFFPFAATSASAVGRALDVAVQSDSYETGRYGTVPVVDAVAAWNDDSATGAVYLVNRSEAETTEVTIDLTALGDTVVVTARTLSDPDLDAANTLSDPDRVGLLENASIRIAAGIATISLPPVSWTEVRVTS